MSDRKLSLLLAPSANSLSLTPLEEVLPDSYRAMHSEFTDCFVKLTRPLVEQPLYREELELRLVAAIPARSRGLK